MAMNLYRILEEVKAHIDMRFDELEKKIIKAEKKAVKKDK